MRTKDIKAGEWYAYSNSRGGELVFPDKVQVEATHVPYGDTCSGVGIVNEYGQKAVVMSYTIKMTWAEWLEVERQRRIKAQKNSERDERRKMLAGTIELALEDVGIDASVKTPGAYAVGIFLDEQNAERLMGFLNMCTQEI